MNSSFSDNCLCGILELVAVPETSLTIRCGIENHRLRWRPPQRLRPHLPKNFYIEFELIASGGRRRLVPARSVPEFVQAAAVAGLAILKSNNRPTHMRATYKMMYFLHQLGPQLRERLDRRLKNFRDLLVPGFENILPENLGTGSVSGQSWTPQMLIAEGRGAAEAAGNDQPDFETLLAYGIDLDAAQRPVDVKDVSAAEGLRQLRTILFDAGPDTNQLTDDTQNNVYGRLVDAIQSHLDDDAEAFNKWFFQNFDGIVHQISKREKPDGQIDRTVVRQAILELTFQSFQSVGQLVWLCMDNVQRCLQPPLSESDRAVYEAVYRSSRYLGDVPLIMLADRFQPLKPSIMAVLDAPHIDERWGRLLRALQTYALIIMRRRDVDRERKRPRLHSLNSVAEQSDKKATTDEAQRTLLNLIVACLTREGIRCDCPGDADWMLVPLVDEISGDPIELDLACRVCGREHRASYSLEQLRRTVHDVAEGAFVDLGR